MTAKKTVDCELSFLSTVFYLCLPQMKGQEQIMKKERRKYTRKTGSNPPGNPKIQPRQSKYKTADEMQIKVDEYFKNCDKKKKPYLVTGLALALGFNTRLALINYEKEENHKDLEEEERKMIVNTIKKAKARVEQYAEDNLFTGRQVAGTIFSLKNNYGWIDRQDLAHSGDLIVNIKGIDEF
jgi:hypothetical protein